MSEDTYPHGGHYFVSIEVKICPPVCNHMMTSMSLSQRLQTLSESYKQTVLLIQELQRFPNGSNSQSEDLDDQRLDLANTCHQSLKDAEENLQLLKQEVEDYETGKTHRKTVTARDEERDRNAATASRLTEDIRNARSAFRRAQLQSKRNLDSRKQKEREKLFANRKSGANESTQPASRQRGQERLTQDEIALNAADDVTRALRRTHALLSSNLQQSQFAQQTLDESQAQLANLSERYTGTTDILQKSRGLVRLLLTSQKSDTWYLQTSFYILLATIAWLVFRRLLYGPLWWFVWLPMKWIWWGITLVLGGAGAAAGIGQVKNDSLSHSSAIILSIQRHRSSEGATHHTMLSENMDPSNENMMEEDSMPPSPEMVEQLKQMVKDARGGTIDGKHGDQARNTKKRTMDLNDEQQRIRDEL